MTLFIVILSITNIALGYGLAIYLGHAQGAPKTVRGARSQQAKEQAPVIEEVRPEPVAATPPPASVAYQPVAEPAAPEPVEMSPVVEGVEPIAAVVETPPVAPVAAPEVAAVEPATEEAVLSQIDEVRAELHETSAPETVVEALAAEPEAASAAPVSEEAAAKPVSKEALLESINAFQAQLKKQQELAKLHAVTSQS